MNLSNRLTFSIIFSVLLAVGIIFAPTVMAQTISAEWADDLVDGTVTGQGWKVTIEGITAVASNTIAVTYLDVNGTVAAATGTQDGFALAAPDTDTSTSGEIAATIGTTIAVQVAIGVSPNVVTYQRVTFPAGGPGAEVASTTLQLLPKLAKLDTSQYYAGFGDTVTVTFNFAAAVADTNGAPMAPLHISDVEDPTDEFDVANWQVIGVSGTNQVMIRTNLASNAASASIMVGLGTNYAQIAGDGVAPNPAEADGHATITYDVMAPTVTNTPGTNVPTISAPVGFPIPPDDVWDSTFILTFSISDDTGGSGLPDSNPVRIMTDETKLDVGTVGLGPADEVTTDTEYLVRITPKEGRTTTAGEEVVITVVPVDMAGNEGGSSIIVKLAASNPAPTASGTIAAQTLTVGAAAVTVNVADKFNDPNDTLTYTVASSDATKASVTISGAVVTITPVAAGTATITVTATDTAGQTATQTIRVTVNAAPVPNPAPTASGTIAAQTVTVGAAAVTVDVASNFSDTDALTYSAVSSDTAKATVSVSGSMVTITPVAAGSATITVTATDTASQTVTQTIMVTVNAAPTPPFVSANPEAPANIMMVEIPAESYVVLVRAMSDSENALKFPNVPPVGGTAVDVRVWSDMPDLHDLFLTSTQNRGGALVLRRSADARDNAMTETAEDGTVTVTGTYATPAVGTVGISEIMWARDLGKANAAEQAAGQWIELQNLNDKPVKVLIYAQRGRDGLVSGGQLVNTAAGDNLLGNPGGMVIDAIQNIRNDGSATAGGWSVKGRDGNSVTGEPFASMHRILPHQKPDYRNADGSRYNNRKGTKDSHWAESGSAYVRGQTLAVPAVLFDYRGSPGDVNARTSIGILTPAGRTAIQTGDGVYINEVANRSDDQYSWIELKGAAGKNLRNYMISIVTSNSSDVPLIQFPNNDNAKIADSGVFLILSSDPANDSNHPIAPGRNVNRGQADHEQYHWNSPVRYLVSNFSLPDDGKFVLVLRKPDGYQSTRANQHGTQGVAETGQNDLDKVVDIAGWDDDLGRGSYPNSVSSTGVWPLYGMRDIKGFTNNSFKQNEVHQRNRVSTNDGASGVGAQDNRNDRTAFGNRGWTGVGYRRGITGGNQNGGTPGYDNGALHNRGGGIVASVYISEIMYSDGSNGTLPQWIELRNTSMTASADLHNWRLTIVNHDTVDAEGTLWDGKASASILLNGLKIKPNSAVLITTRSVTSRSAETYLPNADIFTLYPAHRGTFGMSSPSDDVINVYGFKITLHTRGNEAPQHRELVDEVTNLDTEASDRRGSRERFDPPLWAWPDGMTEDGDRVSVARANEPFGSASKGFTPASGNEASGWILSSMDSRTNNIDLVYYGDKNDISTPGQTVRSPLPVQLSSFRPELEDGKVVIRWATESELDNAGFNIYRSETRDGEYKQVNAELIAGHGTTGERNTYKWIDASAKPDSVYYYQIEDVSFAGERQTLATTKLRGLVSAKNKLTTIWGDLKSQD